MRCESLTVQLTIPTPLKYFPINKKMAPQVGLEPTTDRLTADCSTTELLRNKN
jgi:hypothetical protein